MEEKEIVIRAEDTIEQGIDTSEQIEAEKQFRRKRLISYTSYDSPFVHLIESLQTKYPEELFNIQGISNDARDINEFSKKFFSKSSKNTADLTVDSNANVSVKTVSQYMAEHNKANQRLNGLYLLWKYLRKNELTDGKTNESATETANNILEKVINGEIFVNDLASVERPYCWAQTLHNLVFEGMTFLDKNIRIAQPTRSESFIHLVIQSVAFQSNQIAGAIALPDFFVYLDWYYRKELGDNYINDLEKDKRKSIENHFQNFIYSVNFEFRTGQSPFTNISIMDREFLKALFSETIYPDFSKVNIESVYELGKWFFKYFQSINMKEGIFTFPVITLACSIKDKKYLDDDFVNWICEINTEKAIGNIYTGDPTSLSSCCRLRSDLLEDTGGYQNSFGVGGVSVGSHRVCGINLPRLWKDSNTKKDFFKNLQIRLSSVRKLLKAHRRIIKHHIEIGVLPLYTSRWMNLDKQYSTIGIIGVYELQKYFNETIGIKTVTEKNYKFGIETLEKINNNISIWEDEDEEKYNLEQIPGESVAVRLAEVDRILGKNNEFDLYSNQYIPLIENNISISDRFKIQGNFDKSTSGGSILHINIDESNKITPKQMRIFFDYALETNTIYWAINYTYIKCENEHFFIGNNHTEKCPICDSENIEKFTRVVGFITAVKNWVSTRRIIEFPNRKFYNSNLIEEKEN